MSYGVIGKIKTFGPADTVKQKMVRKNSWTFAAFFEGSKRILSIDSSPQKNLRSFTIHWKFKNDLHIVGSVVSLFQRRSSFRGTWRIWHRSKNRNFVLCRVLMNRDGRIWWKIYLIEHCHHGSNQLFFGKTCYRIIILHKIRIILVISIQ